MVLLSIHVTLKVSINQNIQSNAIVLICVVGVVETLCEETLGDVMFCTFP